MVEVTNVVSVKANCNQQNPQPVIRVPMLPCGFGSGKSPFINHTGNKARFCLLLLIPESNITIFLLDTTMEKSYLVSHLPRIYGVQQTCMQPTVLT
jgi:hypothetical protein